MNDHMIVVIILGMIIVMISSSSLNLIFPFLVMISLSSSVLSVPEPSLSKTCNSVYPPTWQRSCFKTLNASLRLFSRSSAPPNLAPTTSVSLPISMSSLCAVHTLDIYCTFHFSDLPILGAELAFKLLHLVLRWVFSQGSAVRHFCKLGFRVGQEQPENIPKLVFTHASPFSLFAKHLKHFGHCLRLLGL